MGLIKCRSRSVSLRLKWWKQQRRRFNHEALHSSHFIMLSFGERQMWQVSPQFYLCCILSVGLVKWLSHRCKICLFAVENTCNVQRDLWPSMFLFGSNLPLHSSSSTKWDSCLIHRSTTNACNYSIVKPNHYDIKLGFNLWIYSAHTTTWNCDWPPVAQMLMFSDVDASLVQ